MNFSETSRNFISLKRVPNIGNASILKIAKNCPDILNSKISLSQIEQFLNSKQIENFKKFYLKEYEKSTEVFQKCEMKEIKILNVLDLNYPKLLKQIPDAPVQIYLKGNLIDNNKKSISIVGTRKYSDYGKQQCEKYTSKIIENNFYVVSGLAHGIDSISHILASRNGGLCIAVLGCGVDIPYPSINTKLYNNILSTGGTILSEFEPGIEPRAEFFPMRNRIIAGLSTATLVIEAAIKSGSLITAKMAFEYDRDVYALPADVSRLNSQGCNELIRSGIAKLTFSPNDLIEELTGRSSSSINTDNRVLIQNYNGITKEILELLLIQPLNSDDLALKLEIQIFELNSYLTDLELDGIISRNHEGSWNLNG